MALGESDSSPASAVIGGWLQEMLVPQEVQIRLREADMLSFGAFATVPPARCVVRVREREEGRGGGGVWGKVGEGC